MKKIITAALLAASLPFGLSAQETKEKASDIKKPSSDFFMIQLHHDNWNQANSNIKTKGTGRGFSAYLMYDFKVGSKELTHFSFAAGLGYSANNIYFDNQLPNLKTTEDVLPFITTDAATIRRQKYTTGFLEMPLEIRYFGNADNRNRGFKVAVGAKVGLLMNSKVKFGEAINGTYVNQSWSAKKFNQNWKLAPYARVGWGNFSVFAQYNLTNLYQLNKGPEITPFSIGLTITGL